MATHEIYIGGPATANYSRAMFPAAPFNAAGDAFKAVKVAAHKGPTSYGLTRVIDVTEARSLAEYLRTHTVAQGDVLGSILIPQNTMLKGFFFEVERAQGTATTTITPSVRGLAGATLPAIAANTVGKGYARLGDTAWITANGAIDAGAGGAFFFATPAIVDLTLTVLPASGLGALRMSLTPLVENLYHGQY